MMTSEVVNDMWMYLRTSLWMMGPGIYRFVRLARALPAGFLLIWYHFLTDLSFTPSTCLLILLI